MNIAMAAIGEMNEELMAVAAKYIAEHFVSVCERVRGIPVPENSFDTRRQQYSSVAFMLALSRTIPASADRLIGLTECDLFIPMLTFVFGQAQLNGRIALVSIARLRQEFYGMPPDRDLLRLRMEKEIGHELGHSFGLTHCHDRACLMSLATSIQDVDMKSEGFCGSCRKLLPKVLEEEQA